MLSLTLLIPIALSLSTREGVQRWAARAGNRSHRLFYLVCCFLLSAVFLSMFVVAFYNQALHDETTILSGAAAYLHGSPLYPLADAPVEYGLLYGPVTYLVYMPVLFAAQRLTLPLLWDLAAVGAAVFLVWRYLKWRSFSTAAAMASAVLLLAFLLPLAPYVFSVKGDAWILLAMAVGVWSNCVRSKWIAALVLALAGACLVDLKVTLVLAALLPCVDLWRRGKSFRLPALAAMLLMPGLAIGVFLLPGISLRGYRQQLATASHHGLSFHLFLLNLPFAFYLLLPGICLAVLLGVRSREELRKWANDRSAYMALLAGVFGLALLSGAKYGAGPWHLEVVCVPLVVLTAELFLLLSQVSAAAGESRAQMLAVPFALGLVLLGNIAIGTMRTVKVRMRGPQIFATASMPEAEDEVIRILQAHPGETFSMGYTDLAHYNLTSVRPLLQERGMPTLIDPVTRNEDDLAGKPMNPAVVQAVAMCAMPHWILPRQGQPFSLLSLYSLDGSIPMQTLYPASLQRAFLQHYHRVSDGKFFALWDCNQQTGEAHR